MIVRRMLAKGSLWLVLGVLAALPMACGNSDGGGGTSLQDYPEFEVADPAGICTFSADLIKSCTYNFDVAQLMDGQTVGKVFRIINTGSRTMEVSAVTLGYTPKEGEDPPAFEAHVTDPDQRAIIEGGGVLKVGPAGDSGGDLTELNVTVNYTRYDDGETRSAYLTFNTDATNAKDGDVKINLGTLGGAPKISVSPEFVDFERVGQGSQKDQRINIHNTGSMDLIVDKFVLTGTPVYSVNIAGQE